MHELEIYENLTNLSALQDVPVKMSQHVGDVEKAGLWKYKSSVCLAELSRNLSRDEALGTTWWTRSSTTKVQHEQGVI